MYSVNIDSEAYCEQAIFLIRFIACRRKVHQIFVK